MRISDWSSDVCSSDVCDRIASLELGLRIPDAIHVAEPEWVRHSQHWTSAWAGVASAPDVAVAIIDIILNIMFVIEYSQSHFFPVLLAADIQVHARISGRSEERGGG